MKKTYKIIAFIAIILFVVMWVYYSLPEKGLGKYVYVDAQEILHTSNDCKNITHVHGATQVQVYSKNALTPNMWRVVCSHCVSDKIYEQVTKCLQEKASKDSLLNTDWSKYGNENRMLLYSKMLENGINTGSIEEFNNSLDNIEEDREWYYLTSKRIGLDIASRAEFDSLMMLKYE